MTQRTGKHPGGRPSKYDIQRLEEEIVKYLERYQDEQYQLTKTEGDKSTTYENKIRVKLPTEEGFAKFIKTPYGTVKERKAVHNEFSVALAQIAEEQRKRLIESGLSGDYNPTIAKLILSANHGINEKSISEHTGKDGGPMEMIDLTGKSAKELEALRKKFL